MLRFSCRNFAAASASATGSKASASASASSSALNARRSSARFQMLITAGMVVLGEYFVRGCNILIYFVQRPVRRFVNMISHESTTFYVVWGTMLGLAGPYCLYPYLQEILDPDLRQKKEEERIRASLQKGDDPLPFFKDKTNLRGQSTSLYTIDDTSIKLTIDPDYKSMERFRKGRQDDLDAMRRRENEWIRLMEAHYDRQFGVFTHLEKVGQMDRHRRGQPAEGEAWSKTDSKVPILHQTTLKQ